MFQHSKRTVLLLAIAGSLFFNVFSPIVNGKTAVPATIVYEGTKYINCSLVKGYPFQTNQPTEILSGKAVEETGSKSSFWMGIALGEKMLFTVHDKELLYSRNLVGKKLKVKGYPGTGKIAIPDFITKEDRTVIFDNAFFVTEITGWNYVTGYPVSETNDKPADNPSYLWIQSNNQ